jgi:hypothetical protein
LSTTTQNRSAPLGFLGALTLLFICLKLLGKIHWSWLAVFAPLWVPAALLVITFLIAMVVAIVGLVRR